MHEQVRNCGTARDAQLLMLIAAMQVGLRSIDPNEPVNINRPVKIIEIRQRAGECGFDATDAGAFDFHVSTETLIRVRLLEPRDVSEQSIDGRRLYGSYLVTNLGWAFLRAVMSQAEYQRFTRSAGMDGV